MPVELLALPTEVSELVGRREMRHHHYLVHELCLSLITLLLLLFLVGLSADVAPSLDDNSDAVPVATRDSVLEIEITSFASLALVAFRDGTAFHEGPTVETIFALLGNDHLTLWTRNTWDIFTAMRASHIMSPVYLSIYSIAGMSRSVFASSATRSDSQWIFLMHICPLVNHWYPEQAIMAYYFIDKK